MGSTDIDRPSLSPSLLAQYIGYDSCPRYFRYRTADTNVLNEREWWSNPILSPLLSEVGISFEETQLRALAEMAHTLVGSEDAATNLDIEFDQTWASPDDTLDVNEGDEAHRQIWEDFNQPLLEDLIQDTVCRSPDSGPTVLYQAPIRGEISGWEVSGLSDIIVLQPVDSEKEYRRWILEVKSSWSEKSAHQIQAAVYALLLENAFDREGDVIDNAAIIHREQDLREVDFRQSGSIDSFDIETRKTEVQRLLRPKGELDKILSKPFDEVGFRLDRKCDGCEFNEVCFTKAVESKDSALLGLTQGARTRLEEHGIDTLDEFADLYERQEDKRPYDYSGLEIAPGHYETVQSLSEQGTLANRLPELVQRAQVLTGPLDPNYEEFDFVEFLKGTGNGKLPEDSPRGSVDPSCPERGLIRIYMYVQHDYIRDRVSLLGARINGHHIEPTTVVELADKLPMGKEDSYDAEAALLAGFFRKLFRRLREAAKNTPYEDLNDDQAYFHLYLYSSNERNALYEAVRRHPTLSGSRAVRDLLGLREGLDQSMVSVIHTEITERLALHYPGTGLVQSVEQMVTEGWRVRDGYHDLTVWRNDQWKVEVDGKEVNLREVFRTGLFEGMKPYWKCDDSISFRKREEDPDGFYPVLNRFGNQIPLEYIWGVCGEFDGADRNEGDDSSSRDGDPLLMDEIDQEFSTYLYRDRSRNRIRRDDIEALCGRLCAAAEHVERSIRFKNSFLAKEPLPVNLPSFGLPDISLAQACQDYLTLEQAIDEQNCLEHYMDPPLERVKSGESTIFKVVGMESFETRFGTKYAIKGELLYDEFFRNPDHVLDSCKVHGGDGSSSGSWMVMTTLRRDGEGELEQVGVDRPNQIRNSPQITVEGFDRKTREVIVHADEDLKPLYHYDFLRWHRGLVSPTEYAEDEQGRVSPIAEGNICILDPYADSWPNQRAYDCLDYASNNYLYSILQRAYNEGRSDQFHTEFCDPDSVADFLNLCERYLEVAPTGKQREFIEQADRALSVLQGPPGTGKTSYALAPAVLSRMFAFEASYRSLVCGVTAPSHTAVNECVANIRDRLLEYRTADGTDGLEKVVLYRIGGSEEGVPDGVQHIDYYEERDVAEVRRGLELAEQDQMHVILCATPTSMRGFVDRLVGQGYAEAEDAEDFMAEGGSIYDLLVVDEASMLDLPNTLLAGSFLRTGGQTILIGDHRQMEPVQVHEWESEDRRTIQENVPFMSALNFTRFLRGDLKELEFADKQSPEVGDAIPMTGLDRTYRLHRIVADLLTKLIYHEDDITLQSDEQAILEDVTSVNPFVDAAMDPEAPVVLIVHDEDASQDANLTEVAMIEVLMDALIEVDPEGVGVVTPHNAQKARLRDVLGDQVTPNTVEKFQGGERDVIFVTATASDPDYVRAESRFLLNPNRLNVAMSRMKKKLVIIASESVFQIIPREAREYDDAIVWKRLLQFMGVVDESSVMECTLEEFVSNSDRISSSVADTNIRIYTLSDV